MYSEDGMDQFLKFFTCLAWIFIVISFVVVFLRIYDVMHYTKKKQLIDELRGVKRDFDSTGWIGIFILCLAWLISYNY